MRRFGRSLVAPEAMHLNERGLTKSLERGACDKFCDASQLSDDPYKFIHTSSAYAGLGARRWHWKQWFWIRGVSTSCLGGEPATNSVLAQNSRTMYIKSEACHQHTSVCGLAGGTVNNGSEWEGSRHVICTGRLWQIMCCPQLWDNIYTNRWNAEF